MIDPAEGFLCCQICDNLRCVPCSGNRRSIIMPCTVCFSEHFCMDFSAGDTCFAGNLWLCSGRCDIAACNNCIPSYICPTHGTILCEKCASMLESHFSGSDPDIDDFKCVECAEEVENLAAKTFLLIAQHHMLAGLRIPKDVAKIIANMVRVPSRFARFK